MVDSSDIETLLWAEGMYREAETRRGEKKCDGKNYSAFGKISCRLTPGQRIEPVSFGNRIAALSTPQLSQSRNCSFSLFTISGSHPIPRAGVIARLLASSSANQFAHSGIPGIP